MDKCISDLKANLPLDPDYTYVQDYYIGVKDDTITITIDDVDYVYDKYAYNNIKHINEEIL